MGLTTSQTGIDLIKKYEGCRLIAYQDAVGVWTIGYGTTSGVYSGKTITLSQAESLLKSDLAKFEIKVNKYYSKYNWNQNQFDAMVSFAYNVGSIDQLTANGTRTISIIASKILEYNKAGGKVLAGLTTRRKAEQSLFLSGNLSVSTNTSSSTSVTSSSSIKTVQTWLKNYESTIGIDGIVGNQTKKALAKSLQKELNSLGAKLTIDGVIGTKTLEAVSKYGLLKLNSKGNLVKVLEAYLYINGLNPQEFSGNYNEDVKSAVKDYQKNNSLSTDGICGINTWTKLVK